MLQFNEAERLLAKRVRAADVQMTKPAKLAAQPEAGPAARIGACVGRVWGVCGACFGRADVSRLAAFDRDWPRWGKRVSS